MLGCSALAGASGLQQIESKVVRVEAASHSYIFQEAAHRISFGVKKGNLDKAYSIVLRDGKLVSKGQYDANMFHYGSITQFEDTDSARYFYILEASYAMDGAYHASIQGYDTVSQKWRTYVDSRDFYNSIPDAETQIYLDRGRLLLVFQEMAIHGARQEYELQWDEAKNGFSYVEI